MGLSTVARSKKQGSGVKGENVTTIERLMADQLRVQKRIETQLLVKVWVWDRDVGHKLFNFHEGYHVLSSFNPIIGSCK